MYFRTQSDWAVHEPLFTIFDDPQAQCQRWRAVELPLAVYYFHVRVAIDYGKESEISLNLLIGDLSEALRTLGGYPGSALSLQTPEWANNGEPGLFRVNAIYKATTPGESFHFAECANGNRFVLSLNSLSSKVDFTDVEKELIWLAPHASSL